MKQKRLHEMDYQELAAKLARDSIVTKCLARFLEQVIEEVHDSHVKPLRTALEQIANGEGYYGAQAREYKEIARSALERRTP